MQSYLFTDICSILFSAQTQYRPEHDGIRQACVASVQLAAAAADVEYGVVVIIDDDGDVEQRAVTVPYVPELVIAVEIGGVNVKLQVPQLIIDSGKTEAA